MHLDIDGTGGAFMTSLWQLKRFEARISLFKSLDGPLALAAAVMNQRFTRCPPVINHNLGWCNLGMWDMYNLAKAYRSIENPLPIAESRTGKPAMVTLKIQLDCSTVHDTTLWANIFVRSHLGCGTDSVFIRLCRSHRYFKDAKAMQINKILKISLIWYVKLNQPPKQ